MLEEAGVTVLLGRCLESVEMKDNRIVSATMETGETIKASVFIDATYEGDLMAAANVSYRVGREPRSAFGESLAGQWQEVSWKNVYQFCRLPVSPYVVADDPSSGLLPEISPTNRARRARATTGCRPTISACISRTRRGAFPFRNRRATIPPATACWPAS